jgi:hypothetical protein
MQLRPAHWHIERRCREAAGRRPSVALPALLAQLISLAALASSPAVLASPPAAPASPPAARTSTPATPAASIDACALLTEQDISQVIGLSVDEGARKDDGAAADGSYSSTCVWKIRAVGASPADPNAPLNGESFVILNAVRWPAGSGLARRFLEGFRTAAAKGDIPHQPSPRTFGDEALWWGDGLAVREQDVSFGVSVFGPAVKARFPGKFEEQLAPKILPRLAP